MARMPEPDPHQTRPWSFDPTDDEPPSFLQDHRGERPDPADGRLRFADAGPAFGWLHSDEAPPAAGTGYAAFAPAERTSYRLPADSWLAAEQPPVAATPPPATEREWDPLVDPWPVKGALSEPGWIERAARAAADPLGLADLAPDYRRVAFEPAPYAPAPAARGEYPPIAHPPEFDAPDTRVVAPELTGRYDDRPTEVLAPPSRHARVRQVGITTEPVDVRPLREPELEHPSGPLPRVGAWPPLRAVPDTPADLARPAAPSGATPRGFDVTLTGSLGTAELGFRGGQWYSLCADSARPVTVAEAMTPHPDQVGQITQLVCWWLREHPTDVRAVDLATELALAVSDLARRHAHLRV